MLRACTTLWVGFVVGMAGCTQLVDFDRGKIDTSQQRSSADAGSRDAGDDSRDAGCQGDECPECGADEDCKGHPSGAYCVEGDCEGCDPGVDRASAADDRGCPSDVPICGVAFLSCEACRESPDNCPPPTTCEDGECLGCVPGTNEGCGGTRPICTETAPASGKYVCAACAADGDCAGGQCLASGECAACDPDDNAGCGDPKAGFCKRVDGAYGCHGCAGGDCGGATPACETTGPLAGQCVPCVRDTDCTDPSAPLCQDHACVACTAVTGATARCEELRADSVCVTTGAQKGQCSGCDPDTHSGCPSSQLCCEVGGVPTCQDTSAGTQCAACGTPCSGDAIDSCSARQCTCGSSGKACSGGTPYCYMGACYECANRDSDCDADGPEPLCYRGECRACDTAGILGRDSRCADRLGGEGACVTSGSQRGQCGACDPTDHEGCDPSEICCEVGEVATCEATSGDADGQCAACDEPCGRGANMCTPDHACVCGAMGACAAPTPICVAGACEQCEEDADCTSSAAPLCHQNDCVPCDDSAIEDGDERCADALGGVCATSGPSPGRCAECDPGPPARGCSAGQMCVGYVCQ